MDIIKNIVLGTSLLMICAWIVHVVGLSVDKNYSDDITWTIAFPLAILVAFVWKKLDKRYFEKNKNV